MTTRPTPRTWNAGELVTKAMLDEQIRDMANAMWPFSAAGQIALTTASNNLTVLDAASNANKKIISNGTTWVIQGDTRYLGAYLNADVALNTGNYISAIGIPPDLDSYVITSVMAWRKSGTGVPSIQLRNIRTSNNILTTNITIDSGETCSNTAATPPVINAANATVAAYDDIAIDVSAAGTTSLFVKVIIGLTRY